jgi:hypothetical protein
MAAIRKPVNSTEDTKIRKNPFDRSDRLAFNKNPKFYMQWVNDVRNDVQQFLDAGFNFVSEEERWGKENTIDGSTPLDSRASVNVGRAGGMENVTAYLMKCPIDEWQEMCKYRIEEARAPLQELLADTNKMKQSKEYYGDLKLS